MTKKCPSCEEEIDYLVKNATATVCMISGGHSDTCGDWRIDDVNEEPDGWNCPSCDVKIVEDGDEEDFFNDEDDD